MAEHKNKNKKENSSEVDLAEKILESVEINKDENLKPILQEEAVIEEEHNPTDKNWTDYVLSLFSDRELDNGSPKVDGLRRVAEQLFGVFNILTDVVQTPGIDGRATVVVTLEFLQLPRRIVTGAADVYSGNTSKFGEHAVATAETRAEGRALRKALRLVRVLAAEERQGAPDDEARGYDNRITHSMIVSLNLMCNKQQIDLESLANLMFHSKVQDLTDKQGREIATQLRRYYEKSDEIPNEIQK